MIEDILSIRSFNDLRLFYFKYKDSPQFVLVLVVLIGLVSFAVLGKFVLPQLENWATLQAQVKTARDDIKTLQSNQLIVDSISQQSLTEQFDVVTKALPYEKDYSGIISAIDLATLESEVVRDDYSFSVGNLSTQSAKLSNSQSISFQLSLQGELAQIKSFLTIIKEKLPLSEIVSFSYQSGNADLSILFFYRSLPKDLKIVYLSPISTLSDQKTSLLRTLTLWKEKSPEATPTTLDDLSSTDSAEQSNGF